MRHPIPTLLLFSTACMTATAATAAGLDSPHVLDKVTITGSRSVPTDKLMAVIQEHSGATIVQNDIVADRDAIMKVLGNANVGGSVAVRITTKSNQHLMVEFAVTDTGIQAPVVTKIASKLHAEIFDGNVSIPTDKLIAASGLTVGEELSNDKILNAEKAIGDAYKAAKLPVSLSLNGETKSVSPGQVDVTWHIVETKAKKKRNTEDDRQQLEQ